jgi:hypothetical protein
MKTAETIFDVSSTSQASQTGFDVNSPMGCVSRFYSKFRKHYKVAQVSTGRANSLGPCPGL